MATKQSSKTTSKATEQKALRKFLDEFHLAAKQQDRATLEKMVTSDYTFVSPFGQVLDKAQMIDDLVSGRVTISDYGRNDQRLSFHGDTAIVTGLVEINARVQGRDVSGKYSDTATYLKGKDGSWQLAASQMTKT
jgi:ketosteroid isomerase-like protein